MTNFCGIAKQPIAFRQQHLKIVGSSNKSYLLMASTEVVNCHIEMTVNCNQTYLLSKLWNSLPPHIRLASDVNGFKAKLCDCKFLERFL